MIYLSGFLGVLCGFLVGQAVLMWILRGKSRENILEMLKNRDLKFRYGMINWFFALLGLVLFVLAFKGVHA